ncbi:MAG: oligosaccharide flippase family protein, partial [Deltaproteobacteria bacterium]|nr:oligosaccharide flippase family protein [Deltaproteobacteria bacterium]
MSEGIDSQKPGASECSGTQERQASAAGYSLRALFQSSLLYLSGDLGLKLIGLFLVPLYTRVLTPDDYGIIGFAGSLINVLSPVAGLGLIGCLPVLYYSYHGEERTRLISSVVNFTFLYSLAITILILIFGQPVFARFAGAISFNPYIVLPLITLFLTTFYYLPTGIFNMQERALAYSAYSLGLSLVGVGANVLLVLVLRWGALGVLWANLLTGAAGMLVTLVVVRSFYIPTLDRKKLGEILSLSLPALPHLLCSTLSRSADRFFLTGLATLAATGIYSLAMTVSSLVLMVLNGALTALSPHFYRRANAGDPTLAADWARLCTLFIFGGVWVSLGLAMMSAELIQILAPPKYYDTIPLLPFLVLGQALTGLYWLLSPGIGYKRKMWVYPVASFPALAVNLLLNAVLVPRFGAMGAAWAMVASTATQALIFGYFSLRFFPVAYEYRQIGKVILLSATLFAISQLPFFAVFWVGMIFKPILLAL